MITRKAFADLHRTPGRMLLVIVALAIGVWGAGGILVSYVVLTNDLRANYLSTHPAHAVLVSRDFPKLDLDAIRARPEVESAELRDLAMARIEVRPNEWIPLWLFGVDDFAHQAIATLRSEGGSEAPPPGTMVMERDGRNISALVLGTTAKVRAGARLMDVPITGIGFDPGQAPATQDHFIYGYVDQATFSEISGEPAKQRLLVRYRHPGSTAEARALTERLAKDLGDRGLIVSSWKIPELDRHPHQWQLDTLLLLQGTIGGLAFVMSVLVVSQLVRSVIAAQSRQIGVLKAMGATRAQVLAIYLAMVGILGACATVIGVPAAVASGFAFARFVAGKLNFDILTTHLPLGIDLLLVGSSLLLPLLVSLASIVRGTRVSVREALTDPGIAPPASPTRRPSPSSPSGRVLPFEVTLAIRNVLRKKARNAGIAVSMAAGVAILATGFNVRGSLAVLLSEFRASMRHDVQVVLSTPTAPARALAPFADVENVAHVETWSGGRGELQSMVVSTADGIGIVALPRATDLFRPRIVTGRWLAPSAIPEVVMNQAAVEAFAHPHAGDQVTLAIAGKELVVRLVGITEELEKAKVYIDQEDFDSAANPNHLANSVMFVAKRSDFASVMQLKRDVERAAEPSNLPVLYVMSQAERVRVIYDHLDIVLTAITLLSVVVLLVSALGMASSMGIAVLERRREIGVLRALGATPRVVLRIFVLEGLLTSMLSIGLGLMAAWPLTRVACILFGHLMLGEHTVLRATLSVGGLALTGTTTIVFAYVASRMAARRAVACSTRDALAYEG